MNADGFNRYGIKAEGALVETSAGLIPERIIVDDAPMMKLKQTEALRLKITRNKSVAEIAEIMGVTEQTVRKYLKKASKRNLKFADPDNFRSREHVRMEAIRAKLEERIIGDFDSIDYRALTHWEILSKSLREMLGADMPKQLKVEGSISHVAAYDKVEKVNEYRDLVDRLLDMQIGSGRMTKEIEAGVEDAEIVTDEASLETHDHTMQEDSVPLTTSSLSLVSNDD